MRKSTGFWLLGVGSLVILGWSLFDFFSLGGVPSGSWSKVMNVSSVVALLLILVAYFGKRK